MPTSLIVISDLFGQLFKVKTWRELFSSWVSSLSLVDPHMVLEYHAEKKRICWTVQFLYLWLKSEEVIPTSSGVIENTFRPVKSNRLLTPSFFPHLMKESIVNVFWRWVSGQFRFLEINIPETVIVEKEAFGESKIWGAGKWCLVLCSICAACGAVIGELNLGAQELRMFAFMY